MENKKTKKNSNIKSKIWIAAAVLLFILLYLYIYVVPNVSDIFVDTYTAEYGSLQTGVSAECVLIRDEQVYRAQSSGSAQRHIAQGKLVRRNSKILSLAGKAYRNEERGIVSYCYDGLESELTADSIYSVTESILKKAATDEFRVNDCKSKNIAAGDCLFKIVNNEEWYLCTWISEGEARGFEQGSSVTLELDDASDLKARVASVSKEGNKYKLVLSCNRYYEFFDKYRTRKCRIIYSDKTGILLKSDSITEFDGQKGVYVKDKFGSYNFIPISILADDGQTAVAENTYFYNEDGVAVATVKNYDEILANVGMLDKESEGNVN